MICRIVVSLCVLFLTVPLLSAATVATPYFDVPTGTYTDTKTVSIKDSTIGATIRYTTNGTDPTSSSTMYSSPITVNTTTTIKARAFKAGMTDSAVATATYTLQVAMPSFNPYAGTYASSVNVSIAESTTNATVRYTTDGSAPTATSSTYAKALTFTSTTTLKAKGFRSGMTDSSVTSATYTITAKTTATPTFNPGGGTYTGTQSVSISDSTPGNTIYYTKDSSTPTTGSTKYTSPISVSSTTTIKAIATASGYNQSAVGSAIYTIQPRAATPTFNPKPDTYTTAQAVAITDATPNATIYYTTTGATPTTSSTRYNGPVSVSTSQTIKAIATAPGYAQSTEGSASYIIQPQASTPTLSVGSSTAIGPVQVSISCTTTGATIRYTFNGTDPTTNSPAYNGMLIIPTSTTLKARAFKTGMTDSPVASATYTITPPNALTVDGDASPGALKAPTQVDWYRFTVTFDGKYVVETHSTLNLTDTYAYLYTSDLPATLLTEDNNSGVLLSSKLQATLRAGTYYVKVIGASSLGAYTIDARPDGQPWEFKVAFGWSGAQLNTYEPDFRRASNWIYEATQGQFRIRKYNVYVAKPGWTRKVGNWWDWLTADLQVRNDCAPGETSETLATGMPWPISQVVLCNDSWNSSDKTIAHELGHYKFTLGDEYTVQSNGKTCNDVSKDPKYATLCRSCPDNRSTAKATSMCLMTQILTDEHFNTQYENGATVFLHEYCTKDVHNNDTDQGARNHKSCWETIKDKFSWVQMPSASTAVRPGPCRDANATSCAAALVIWNKAN